MEIKRNLNKEHLSLLDNCQEFQSPMEIKRNLNSHITLEYSAEYDKSFQSPMEIKRNLNLCSP